MRSQWAFRPKKRLGQHFLRDRGVIKDILDLAGFQPSDMVLEIGAGLGALTIPLAERVHEIIAVEMDYRLIKMLEDRFPKEGIARVTFINEDILSLNLKGITSPSMNKHKIIGNLPYNISSPFLEKLIRHRDLFSKAVLMFQLEFANRLLASPGGKEYGALTVSIQYEAHVSPLLEVSRESFHPRPKVGSMVLAMDMERPYPRRAEDEKFFKSIVNGAFAYRRKTILNSLKRALDSYDGKTISGALNRCAIDPMRRAETLGIDEFLHLASALKHP